MNHWTVHGTKANATISCLPDWWFERFNRWFHKRDVPKPLWCVYATGLSMERADAIRETLEREQQ